MFRLVIVCCWKLRKGALGESKTKKQPRLLRVASLVDETLTTLTRKWKPQLPPNTFCFNNLELDKRNFVDSIAAFVVLNLGVITSFRTSSDFRHCY